MDFGTNPYSSNFRGLVFNLYATGLVIFFREYIRYKLMHNVYNKDKIIIFSISTLALLFIHPLTASKQTPCK